MSGRPCCGLRRSEEDGERLRTEAELAHSSHQAGPTHGTVLLEQRTTRCHRQALACSACNALFLSFFCVRRELPRNLWPAAEANWPRPAAVNWRWVDAIRDN